MGPSTLEAEAGTAPKFKASLVYRVSYPVLKEKAKQNKTKNPQ